MAGLQSVDGRPPTNPAGPAPSFALLVFTVSLGTLIAPLNSTMIAVALPDLRARFDIGSGEIAWLVSAYLIAMAIGLPIGGRIGDQAGRSAAFRSGLLAFLVFSIAAAVAPRFEVLVLLRIGQALAGAVVIPNGLAMLRTASKAGRFGEANGIVGAVIGLSAAIGPVLGAALLEAGSWRLLFLVNVPLVIAALGCQTVLRYEQVFESRPLRIDWLGALALAGTLVSLTYLLGRAGSATAGELIAATAAVVLFGALFGLRQSRSPLPVTEWSLFRLRSFTAATSIVLLTNMIMYTMLLAIPFFLKEVQGRGDASVGFALGSMSILMALLAPLTGRFSDRQGRRLPAVAGGACMAAAATVLFLGVQEHASIAFFAVSLAVLGLGIGLGVGPATVAAIEAAPVSQSGIAAGTVSMMRYFGSIAGAGVLGSLLSDGTPDVEVFRLLFAAVAVTAVLTTLGATQIHRFVAVPAASNRTAEPLS